MSFPAKILGQLVEINWIQESVAVHESRKAAAINASRFANLGLRAARFERARDELRRSEPEATVTDVATRWGFDHMGRFAVEYRRRFGESPSQTLGKRRHRKHE